MCFIASSSSCTSSVANIGSPKPEKRQANSPLPPTPAVSPDMYARVDKNHSRENSRGSINVSRNLEDMYAKVQKNKKKYDDDAEMNSRSYTPDVMPYSKIQLDSRQSWSSKDSFDESKHFDELCDSSDSDLDKKLREEHCYETLNKKKVSPNKKDQDYEKIRNHNWLADELLGRSSGPESILSNDPGYEQLNHSRLSSEADPNYEVLRPHRTSSLNSSIGNYCCKLIIIYFFFKF